MATAQGVFDFLNAYIKKNPQSKNSDWYVGIAADPKDRLFVGHSVDQANGIWAYEKADSNAIARQVEKAYHDAGYSGGPGGGDDKTIWVYAYVITSSTAE
jgi:hypothetical protein